MIAYIINYKDEENQSQSIALTNVNDGNVDLQSRITSHPLITGEIVADHKYDEPITMSINGAFSLNTNEDTGISGSRYGLLKVIQSQFEYLKKNAILCTIMKVFIDKDNKKAMRFQKRVNMVLSRISWTEQINSLKYVFDFTEVMLVDVQDIDVDVHDTLLPDVGEFNQYNFTETLLDINELDKQIIEVLLATKVMDDDFMNYTMSLAGAGILVGAAGAVLLAVVTALAVSGTFTAGIGTAVAGVVMLVAGTVGAAYEIYTWIDRAQKFGQLKLATEFKVAKNIFGEVDETENQKRVEALKNFLYDIHLAMEDFNKYLLVYQVSKDGPQENWINIDGDYYKIRFYRNNASNGEITVVGNTIYDESGNNITNLQGNYCVSVYNIDGAYIGGSSNISTSPRTFTNCTSPLFRTSSGAGVYLVHANLSIQQKIALDDWDSPYSADSLLNYYLLISKVTPQQYTNTIDEIVKNHLFK